MTIGNAMYVHSRKYWFCGNYGLSRLADKRVWCSSCRKKYSLLKLKRDLEVLYYFYLEVSARKCALELHLSYKSVAKRHAQFRKAIMNYSEKEFKKLRGLVEADEFLILEENIKATVAEELLTNRQSSESSRGMAGFTLLQFQMFLQKLCLNILKRKQGKVQYSILVISDPTKI